ncbi:MAG: pilus assembly protein N-terminal domain-containing protein, partial [Pirellulaceae bacterium]
MIISQQRARFSVLIALALVVALSLGVGSAWSVKLASAQSPETLSPETPGVNFQVDAPNQRLEMIVNSSRIFTLDSKIPKAQVNNPDLLKLTPLSPTKIQVSATKPGVTQVNLWTEDGSIHTVDVVVIGDGRELQMLLESEFPNSTIKVRPLASSVVLSGYVDRPEAVSRIVAMAEDYYPRVINNINVGGAQQVALKVKVYEVSRTKLETLGFDFAAFNGNDFITSSVSGIIEGVALSAGEIPGAGAGTMTFGVLGDNSGFFGFVEALQQNNLAKLLSEPTLMSISGRPASFLTGGEVPIEVASGLGTNSI